MGSFGLVIGQGGISSAALSSAREFALPVGSQESVSLDLARELSYLYPQEIVNLDSEILSPEQFFGAKTGSLHLTYELVTSYLRHLSRASNRLLIRVDGATYQGQPFVSAIISSSKNLEGLRSLSAGGAFKEESVSKELLVNWLGYSVHGNEASGVNASVVMAYLLVAGQDAYVTDILENTLVVLVPALNPDGVSGYANWVNSNISFAVNKDEFNREFRQQAPTSRSNHYWFDLNRDWLFAQHPESRAVLRLFHEFKPHVVNDFHEHGNVSGTYFSPGLESSTNSLIDSKNWELTNKIAQFHASYMDSVGSLYFSREGYDNFYTGKSAAYPSLAGSIGILYEQPNSKGLDNFRQGVEVRLVNNIRNQVFCSFSSLVGSAHLKGEIFSYRERVARESRASVAKNGSESYVFSAGNDISLRNEFFKILDAHNIKYYRLKEGVKVSGLLAGNSGDLGSLAGGVFAVPLDQEYPAIIKSIFEPQLDFVDSSFYDISTWTIPMAFNITYSKSIVSRDKMEELPFDALLSTAQSIEVPQKSNYAYLFSMDDYYSYNFLYYLLDNGVFVKASDRPFSFDSSSFVTAASSAVSRNVSSDVARNVSSGLASGVASGVVEFGTGSIVIPVTVQSFGSERLYEIICAYFLKHSALEGNQEFAYTCSLVDAQTSAYNRDFFKRGFVANGVLKVHALLGGRGVDFDLGSRKFNRVTLPSVAIITGVGATYSSVGELWHLLDHRFRIPVTLLDYTLITASRLANYNVVVCTNNFNMDSNVQDVIANWAEVSGNTFVALTDGVRFASKSGIAKVDLKSTSTLRDAVVPIVDDNSSVSGFSSDSYISKLSTGRDRSFNGVILKSLVDQSHPLGIGVSSEYVPVFKRGNFVAQNVGSSFATYSIIAPDPLMSGYLSSGTSRAIANTPYIIAKKGFVFFPDNPYFRGYWLGTSRAFLNALFFRELL